MGSLFSDYIVSNHDYRLIIIAREDAK